MITLERTPPPIVPPADSPFFRFYDREFSHPVEPYPKGHLVGRVALEDCVAAAEACLDTGLSLSTSEQALLRLSHEYVDDDYSER